jgi:aminopeptidase N
MISKISILSIFTLFLGFTLLAQKESFSCQAVKTKNFNAKSNTLSLNQITETDRYDVTFYNLDLNMTNQTTSLSGFVDIHGKAKENLDSVLFELFDSFTIDEIRLNDVPVLYSRNLSAIKVAVNLLTNESFKISVFYHGTPPNGATNPLGGSGMTNATSPSWGNRITWSLSEPFSAFEWFPCKQSLTDKADSVDVNLTVPSACKGGSNGVLTNEIDLGNGNTRFEWKHRHPIAYYLISVAVGEYIDYTIYANPVGVTNPVEIKNYIYNNPQTLTNFIQDIDETVDFLEYFSEIFGLYPYHEEKYGHCMAPLSGGMEHQTMTTQGFFEKTLTAHELAHQWWGDLVTCKSWADIWVNEGFASYAEYLMLQEMYPNEAATDMNNRHTNIKSQLGGSVWVEDSLNSNRIFSGRLSYDKGAAIIHTLRYILNDDAQFFQALNNFLNIYKNSNAMGIDVQHELELISGLDLSEAFEQWYFGEGFPTYSAKWNLVDNKLHVQINQTVSMPSVTPLFTNPLDVRFQRTGLSDTIIRFDISAQSSNFIIENLGTISNLTQIDPNNWLINSVGTIQRDFNLNLANIELQEIKEIIEIYPNPSTDILEINLNTEEEFNLIILDTKGKICYSKAMNSIEKIDISSFEAGLYLFQFSSSNGKRITRKIIRK